MSWDGAGGRRAIYRDDAVRLRFLHLLTRHWSGLL